MSVPVPVTISMAAPPLGWTAQTPNQFQKLATLVASLMTGSITASFLTGQVGGSAPSSDIGPWANGNEWWVWEPATSVSPAQYQPSQQGAPVGTIMMWANGNAATVPARWLLCQGQALAIATYPRLYSAIGNTWRKKPAAGVFYLPPPAVFFANAPGFYAPNDPNFDASQSPDKSVNITGGRQVENITPLNLPACKISIPVINTQMNTGSTNMPNIQLTGSNYLYPVTDEFGNQLGANRENISIMPPFCVVYFVIKYM